MKTKPFGPFLGINNRLPDFALATKNGRWLRDAENVHIDGSGSPLRRKAATLIQALSAPHSLYTAADGRRYLVVGGSLFEVTLPSFSSSLRRLLMNNNPVRYAEDAGSLYYSNGTDTGRIEAGVWYPWALPTPAAPAASTIAGALYAGKYQIAVSHVNGTTGEEGGISPSGSHELAAAGGIRVTLPAPTEGATHINVYVSTVNGSIPMLVGTVAAGTATYDHIANGFVGREANQRHEAPIPAGVPFFHNSRLCTYSGGVIYIGIPARHGYYQPTGPRIEFAAPITNAISGQNGVYITADKTYWFEGPDLLDAQRVVDVFPYGAVAGTAFVSEQGNSVGWFGRKGLVLANTAGEAQEIMAGAIDQDPPASGVSAVLSVDGCNLVVSCGWCVNLEGGATTRYTDYGFTSISGDFATGPGGVYDLAADGRVDWLINFGKEDFGTEALKSLPACYVGAASDEPVILVVTLPDGEEYEYPARSCSDSIEIHRIDTGKGLKENWYGLALKSDRGSSITLATVSFAPVASGRRI